MTGHGARLVGRGVLILSTTLVAPALGQSSASFPAAQPAPAEPPTPSPVAPTYTAPTYSAPAPTYSTPAGATTGWDPGLASTEGRIPEPAVRGPSAPPPVPAALRRLPPYLPYHKGAPVPAAYEVVHRPRVGMITVGAITLGASYAYAVGSAAGRGFERGESWLALPLVGPWGALASRKISACRIDVKSVTDVQNVSASKKEVENCIDDALKEAIRIAVIAADGVIQIFGGAFLVTGLASGEKELVRKDLHRVRVTPQAFNGRGWGMGLSGRF